MILGLSGPEAEREFCRAADDGGDCIDYEMARRYLARRIDNPLHAAAELARFREAAQRLVRSPCTQARIRLLADALLRNVSGDEILGLEAPSILACARLSQEAR